MDTPKSKPPSARAAMAMAKAQAYQDAADAPSTLRVYASDLRNYEAWRARYGMSAMPATPQVVGAYGLATIWDNDIILYLRTQIIEALNRDREVSKRISFHIHDCLVATGRGTGGREYELFKEALTRLKTTTVLTNISTSDEIADEGFGWLESFKIKRRRTAGGADVMASCEVVISDWLFGLFLNSRRALTIDRAYFGLQGGLERKLYGIVRKHLGNQSFWQIGTDTLKDLCGVKRDVRRFTYDLKKIVARGLPGFDLELTKDPRGLKVVGGGAARVSKRTYLVVRPGARLA